MPSWEGQRDGTHRVWLYTVGTSNEDSGLKRLESSVVRSARGDLFACPSMAPLGHHLSQEKHGMNTGEHEIIAITPGLDTRTTTRALADRLPALVTMVLGLAMVFSVGFAHVTVLHNGAHDTRHANGFPCH